MVLVQFVIIASHWFVFFLWNLLTDFWWNNTQQRQ